MSFSDPITAYLVVAQIDTIKDRYRQLLSITDDLGSTWPLKVVLNTFLGLLDFTDTEAIVRFFSGDVKREEGSDADFNKLANFFKALHELKQQGVAIDAREQELRYDDLHRN